MRDRRSSTENIKAGVSQRSTLGPTCTQTLPVAHPRQHDFESSDVRTSLTILSS